MKPLVLILCTGNSCRSHLAEGLLRAAAGDLLEVASAGSKPAGYVHPLAIEAMREVGVDISAHHSKHMDEFLSRQVETVITVCGNADQACPMFPGQLNRHHWGFDDPAHATGTVPYNVGAQGTVYFLPTGITSNYRLNLGAPPSDANTQYTIQLINSDVTGGAVYQCNSVYVSASTSVPIYYPVDVMVFSGTYVVSPVFSVQTIDFVYQDTRLYALSTAKQYTNAPRGGVRNANVPCPP